MRYSMVYFIALGLFAFNQMALAQARRVSPQENGNLPAAIASIKQELDAAYTASYDKYITDEIYSPTYHPFMVKNMPGPIQHHLDVLNKLIQAQPKHDEELEFETARDLALLTVFADDASKKKLISLSQSSIPLNSLTGKVGLAMAQWWAAPDAMVQEKTVSQMADLDKGNPKSDLLCYASLEMSRFGASSLATGNELRHLILDNLKGGAAARYKLMPDKIGFPFILSGKLTTNKSFSTKDWAGKVILVDFWATWCPPCVASLPELSKVYQDNHSKGLEVIGVDNDMVYPDLKDFLAKNASVVWPQIYSPNSAGQWNKLSVQYKVNEIPTMFVIDRNGILRMEITSEIPKELIDQLVAEKTGATTAPSSSAKSVASGGATQTPHSSGAISTAPPQ